MKTYCPLRKLYKTQYERFIWVFCHINPGRILGINYT